jgi:hypothetical protein
LDNKMATDLRKRIDDSQRRGYSANIVLHDGNHRSQGADRGPSIAATEQLLERYDRTHQFVTLDAWG